MKARGKERLERGEMGVGCKLLMVLIVVVVQGGEGTTWRVGDSNGWQLDVDFSGWTHDKVFEVGDILLFSYNKTTENLLEVSAADYATCTTVAPIAQYTDGNSSVLLGNLTTRYFISGIPGHCLAGMTLQIQMGAQSPSPAPTPAPIPAPLSAPVPSPTSTSPISVPPPLLQISSPPPGQPSSAPPSFTVLSLAILLSVATSIGAALIL